MVYASHRNINFPTESKELAEFFGVLTGDGYMNKYGKYFCLLEITGHSKLDYDYLSNYVSLMINKLFNLKPTLKVRKDQNTMYLRITSKDLFNHLEKLGFKKGKKGQIGIPNWILEENEYMKYFIRGLADTDGCLALINKNYKRKNSKFYPRVQIGSISKILINYVGYWLRKQGIPLSIFIDTKKLTYKGKTRIFTTHKFQISGDKNLEKWMNLISFKNKKHLDKYKLYKRSGLDGIRTRDT